jgi:methanethiol S-methyltransferase
MPSVQTSDPEDAHAQRGIIQRAAILLYGLVVYALFLATFIYFIAFVESFFVPRSVDVGPTVPLARALLIDLLLVSVFAVQHTVMARSRFKLWLTRVVPQPAERSTFVLAATLALFLMMARWPALSSRYRCSAGRSFS